MRQSYVNKGAGFLAALNAAVGQFLTGIILPKVPFYRADMRRGWRQPAAQRRRSTGFARDGARECERRQRQIARGRKLDAIADVYFGPSAVTFEVRTARGPDGRLYRTGSSTMDAMNEAVAMPFPHAGASLRRANGVSP